MVALQNAVHYPGAAALSIISGGVPSAKYLKGVEENLRTFEPESLRPSVTASWERESSAETREDDGRLLHDQIHKVTQPALVLAGRSDRTCSVEAAMAISRGIPQAELEIFEHSGHMTFVEENERYISVVRAFIERRGPRS